MLAQLIPVKSFDLPDIGETTKLDHGIERIQLKPRNEPQPTPWVQWLQARRAEGFRLVQSEWHHQKFEIGADGKVRSEVTIALHVKHESHPLRLVIDGAVKVVWAKEPDTEGIPVPETIDVSGLRILRGGGAGIYGVADIRPSNSVGQAGWDSPGHST
ncbi:MAG: hypothetical protein R3F19_19105 [Verrucomicrobiales bacterium]